MSEAPWLTIIGVGEDGPEGLSSASRAALDRAEIVMGPPRHLALFPNIRAETIEWPVPFADGIARLGALRGRPVVVLASGDPFWFGAGSVLARHFSADEWRTLPGLSTFSLAAARMGWPIERTTCLGLHAASLSRIRPHLAPGERIILLLRDGHAVRELAELLTATGFGQTRLIVMERLGGPHERVTTTQADCLPETKFAHPVCVAVNVSGDGPALPRASGIDDGFFDHDGQITKRPIRALTLSALAPKPRELLWDIGSGSGSIAIEWLLTDPSTEAVSIEQRPDRAARIRANAAAIGVDRLAVVEGRAPAALEDLAAPDAVFTGGGLSEVLLENLHQRLQPGTRLVANAVTLESEALLSQWRQRLGGELLRIDLAEAVPLGSRHGWRSAYPVTQWSVTL